MSQELQPQPYRERKSSSTSTSINKIAKKKRLAWSSIAARGRVMTLKTKQALKVIFFCSTRTKQTWSDATCRMYKFTPITQSTALHTSLAGLQNKLAIPWTCNHSRTNFWKANSPCFKVRVWWRTVDISTKWVHRWPAEGVHQMKISVSLGQHIESTIL